LFYLIGGNKQRFPFVWKNRSEFFAKWNSTILPQTKWNGMRKYHLTKKQKTKTKTKKPREFNAKWAVTILPQANRLIHQGA